MKSATDDTFYQKIQSRKEVRDNQLEEMHKEDDSSAVEQLVTSIGEEQETLDELQHQSHPTVDSTGAKQNSMNIHFSTVQLACKSQTIEKETKEDECMKSINWKVDNIIDFLQNKLVIIIDERIKDNQYTNGEPSRRHTAKIRRTTDVPQYKKLSIVTIMEAEPRIRMQGKMMKESSPEKQK
ncbi:hypothetical protein L9F63_015399 [Diploptera punctata]|uniref:Uncharacterized protein n=1 Tax=Diploptera punctata TaxID=6984 RepID=A0AAD8A5P5_DIPPU|nr:hypothetical protein L9F63_015399 [Diploptera punctata]